MWSAKRVSADVTNGIQVDAGLLLNKFDVGKPTEPADADIVCATTGEFHLTCTPEPDDFFGDINGMPKNTREGKRIKGWACNLAVTALSITEETLKLALGAADGTATDGVNPRTQYKPEDFKSLYWIGDMVQEDKLFVVVMDNTVSTGGLDFTASDDGKGNLALNLMPHASLDAQTKVPMAFYVLTKQAGIGG